MIIPVRPIDSKSSFTTEDPLQVIPDQRGEQGSVLVTPSVVQDHIVLEEIDCTLVAATSPHKASSCAEGHISRTVAGRSLSVTVVKHKGAHVTNGLEPESVICK